MLTLETFTEIQKVLIGNDASTILEDTLIAAFLPEAGEDAAYFALSTPESHAGPFTERLRAINQWFIEGTGVAPDALLVNPSLKRIVEEESWQVFRADSDLGPFLQVAPPPADVVFLANPGEPRGLGRIGKTGVLPGTPLLTHPSVPENIIGHLVGISGNVDWGVSVEETALCGITVIVSPQVLADAVP